MNGSEFMFDIGNFFGNEKKMHLGIAPSPGMMKEKNIQVFPYENGGGNEDEGGYDLETKGHKPIGKSFGVCLRSESYGGTQ